MVAIGGHGRAVREHDKSRGARKLWGGALFVRRSRGEGCDSAAGLAKSDPRAPCRWCGRLDVEWSSVLRTPGLANNGSRGRDPSLASCGLPLTREGARRAGGASG
jgi:hypothetical protein